MVPLLSHSHKGGMNGGFLRKDRSGGLVVDLVALGEVEDAGLNKGIHGKS
jgi:hypothetical protein